MSLVDENAFGLLVAFHDLEDAEYSLEPPEFVVRFTEFTSEVLSYAEETPLGPRTNLLELGHALYFELADGDQSTDLIAWLRNLRTRLVERGFEVCAVLSHGSRWVEEADAGSSEPWPRLEELGGTYRWMRASRPSEPLRRALAAEVATHGGLGEDSDGWGSGCYLDSEAMEALGKTLKNAPTPLEVAGATFFRIGR
ncbi:MAG TPA: hypothetical protein VFQ61_33770 [Polyangiaceae bacterium]|nr:hypothetical protein [Polyangiaceae bacterium]